ncbi:MAG: hypothetical protein DME24_22945 [Verrucomicrobia bacterium]|nr:MAG: hypothetical protein DME24_22945 [Verrucomicrobiota bacterium]
MVKTCLKILPSLIACIVCSQPACAQGTIWFANRLSSTIFVPFYLPDCFEGSKLISGTNYSAQLYADIGGTMTALGNSVPFRTGAGAGSWAGVEVTIPGILPGESVPLQVRVWENVGGAYPTYESAVAAGRLFEATPVFTSAPLGGDGFSRPNIIGNAQAVNNMQSAPGEICPLQLSAPAIQAGSSFSFGVSIDGTPYAIECSTNLVTWSDVFTNNNPSQPFSFADTNTLTSSAQRFYRARRLQ